MPEMDVLGRGAFFRPQLKGALHASEACPRSGHCRDDPRFDRLRQWSRRIRSNLVWRQDQTGGAGLQQCTGRSAVAFGRRAILQAQVRPQA